MNFAVVFGAELGERAGAIGARPDAGCFRSPHPRPDRRKHIHFEAPAAERLPQEVAAFLKLFEGRDSMDPVLRAGVSHLWFVTPHPFEDGNGRLSRAIADMALARAEGATARFYSMSTQIEADKKAYYLILEQTQKGAWTSRIGSNGS